MEIDLDHPLDDIFPAAAPKNTRAGGKFQPKAKLGPRKESLASIPGSHTETLRAEEPFKKDEDSFSGVHSNEDIKSSGLDNTSPKHIGTKECMDMDAIDRQHSDTIMPEGDQDWHSYSCFQKSAGENVDIFLGLESFDDFLSQPETVMGRSCPEVDTSSRLGNNISASCRLSADAGGDVPHSDPSTGHVSDMRNAAEGVDIPLVYDTSGIADTAPAPTSPQLPAARHTLSCRETAVSNHDGDFHIVNTVLEREFQEVDVFPSLDTLDIISELTTRSVGRTGKFQPKPKRQIHKKNHDTGISSEDAVESVSCRQDGGSKPELPPYDGIDLLSVGLSESIPQLHVNEEPSNPTEISHSDDAIIGEQSKASTRSESGKTNAPTVSDLSPKDQKVFTSGQGDEAGRSLRLRRKRANVHALVEEPENEDLHDAEFPAKRPDGSVVNEYDDEDEENQMENDPKNKKVRRKSKKNVPEKQKPVRKCKRSGEVSDQSTKELPKKFSHSTRRSIRRVDKVLLETPEDEVDFQKLPMRDLILLAEYKEKALNKEAPTSETPLMNQSGGHSNDEQENPTVQESSTFFNYHSYMERTPIARWSKQDTELFYEGVRQFGSDLSMIQQLFPARTRRQLKLKYKKEERHHRLRLHEALANRAKDHAHFKLVIERLQEIAAQEKHNSNMDDSIDLTSEDAVEDATVQTNEDVAKSEQTEEGGVENMETYIPEVSSPVKSYNSEDEYYRWSQYKSEL